MQVQAASAGSLFGCGISISAASGGINITCSAKSTETADEIGVKDIVLQEKVNGIWKNISIAGGSAKNSDDYTGYALYTGAVKGRSYRAYCTYYAKYGSVTKTLKSGTTDTLVFN